MKRIVFFSLILFSVNVCAEEKYSLVPMGVSLTFPDTQDARKNVINLKRIDKCQLSPSKAGYAQLKILM